MICGLVIVPTLLIVYGWMILVKISTINKKEQEIFTKGWKNLEDSIGCHFTTKIIGHSSEVISNTNFNLLIINGIYKNKPRECYMKINEKDDKTIESEIYMGIKGRPFYHDCSNKNWWYEIDDVWLYREMEIFYPKSIFIDKPENMSIINTDNINGIECWVIEVALNEEDRGTILMASEPVVLKGGWPHHSDDVKMVTSYRIWIGKTDNFIYKIVYSLKATLDDFFYLPEKEYSPRTVKINVVSEVSIFDYNKNIDIKTPPKVQEWIDKYYPLEKSGGK